MSDLRRPETSTSDRLRSHRPRRSHRPAVLLVGAVAVGALATAGVLDGALLTAYPAAHAQTTAPAQAAAPAARTTQSAPAPQATAAPTMTQFSFAPIVNKVKPAVVSVRVKMEEEASTGSMGGSDSGDDNPLEEFLRRFGQGRIPGQNPGRNDDPGSRSTRPRPHQFGMAQGSGFFISSDGYLVTNNHVVEHGTDIKVVTDDGRTLPAKVVGTDPKTDIALLRVSEGGPFPSVGFADTMPAVGDWVLAVGNPFGLGGTVTAGIVSAHHRDIGAGPYDDFIQIDAPINRGNSGGPTFNLDGQVVGVNTAIASPSGGNVGIAFAISASTVQQVVAQLKDKGYVERGYLGVQIQPVTKDLATGLGLDQDHGALVASVQDDTPAAKAGLKPGDAILAVNGKPVDDARDLSRKVAAIEPGATVDLNVWRNGARKDISVKLGTMPNDKTAAAGGPDMGAGRLGLQLAPAENAGLDRKGVAIIGVDPNSPAADKGFKVGEVIAEVAGKPVETPADVRQALAQARQDNKKVVLFRVESAKEKGMSRYVAVQVPSAG